MTLRLGRWAAAACLAVLVLGFGFPSHSAEGRAALATALVAAVAGAASPAGVLPVVLFALASVSGVALALGSAAGTPWPSLLLCWFVVGWSLVRMRSPSVPRQRHLLDSVLLGLGVLWLFSSVAAVLSARTWWAAVRDLAGRVVNVQGMSDLQVLRETGLSLAAVGGALLLYTLVRSLDAEAKRRAVGGLVAGVAVSALAAVLQSIGLLPALRAPYWRTVGRYQGLAADPNALGVLCGLALGPALFALVRSRSRLVPALAAGAAVAGLAASGSRSGFLIAAAILIALPVGAAGRARSGRLRWAAAVAAVVLIIAAALLARGRGNLAARLIESFDSDVPFAARASSRPLLWRVAIDAFEDHPLAGLGWNAYSWQLPNYAARLGSPIRGYDNPGSFYLQALCETGVPGALLVICLAAALVVAAIQTLRAHAARSEVAAGSAAALLGFLAALAVGSHLMAAEVAAAFFVLTAVVAPEVAGRPAPGISAGLAGLVGLGLVASILSPLSTRDSSAAFRYAPTIGFHGVERSSEGPFRWMRERAALRLPAGARQHLTLVFADPVKPRETLRIEANGRIAFARPLLRGRFLRLTLEAPLGKEAIFLFVNSASFQPSAIGRSRDDRQLALQVYGLPAAW
jgi:O-antigen ligase